MVDRLDRRVRAIARNSPYALIAISMGAGFLLGSRSSSRLLGMAVAFAGRFVVSELVRFDGAPVDDELS